MQLRTARLCLDCEEIHDAQMCPSCGSESFTYITRWVPAPERRVKPREPATPEAVDAYRRLLSPEPRRGSGLRWATGGVIGLATLGLAQWWLRSAGSRPAPSSAPAAAPTSESNRSDRLRKV